MTLQAGHFRLNAPDLFIDSLLVPPFSFWDWEQLRIIAEPSILYRAAIGLRWGEARCAGSFSKDLCGRFKK